MSVESLVIAAMVQQGSPRAAYQAGITKDDFVEYDEEFQWIEERSAEKRPINRRIFKDEFGDFEFIVVKEKLSDLLDELKEESAFVSLSAAVDEVLHDLSPSNALEKASMIREIANEIVRTHSAVSDVPLGAGYQDHLATIRQMQNLRRQGKIIGISTGMKNLDHHWGGLLPGRVIVVLGRPGDAKSFTLAKFATHAAYLQDRNLEFGLRVGFFSPEMNEFEHRCRIHTLLSSNLKVQQQAQLRKAFRNRALMDGQGFNIKTYKRFCEWVASKPGEIFLFTQKWRRTKMTASYIESKIDDLGLDMVVVDPIFKLKSSRRRDSKREEIEDVVDSIQDIAEAFQIPIVISNQANRQHGTRGDAPHKDSSYNSDAPVQEGSQVVGVYHSQEERKLIMRCTKNRFGGNFRIEADFYPNLGVLEDVTPIQGNYLNGNESEADEDEDVQTRIERSIKR